MVWRDCVLPKSPILLGAVTGHSGDSFISAILCSDTTPRLHLHHLHHPHHLHPWLLLLDEIVNWDWSLLPPVKSVGCVGGWFSLCPDFSFDPLLSRVHRGLQMPLLFCRLTFIENYAFIRSDSLVTLCGATLLCRVTQFPGCAVQNLRGRCGDNLWWDGGQPCYSASPLIYANSGKVWWCIWCFCSMVST